MPTLKRVDSFVWHETNVRRLEVKRFRPAPFESNDRIERRRHSRAQSMQQAWDLVLNLSWCCLKLFWSRFFVRKQLRPRSTDPLMASDRELEFYLQRHRSPHRYRKQLRLLKHPATKPEAPQSNHRQANVQCHPAQSSAGDRQAVCTDARARSIRLPCKPSRPSRVHREPRQSRNRSILHAM